MFENIFNKFKEPKVMADKFVKTFTTVTDEYKDIKKEVNKEKQVESAFFNLFRSAPKVNMPPPPPKDFDTTEYFRLSFEPFSKRVKEELSKHQREVRVNINPLINISTLLIMFKGREEYQYIVQIKAGKTEQTSKIIVKETGVRGGHDERSSLTGLTPTQVPTIDLLTDFLEGYKRHLDRKGWS